MDDNIIEFPVQQKQDKSDLEAVIEKALAKIPEPDRQRLKFELIKTIDSYDAFFTQWVIDIPANVDEAFKKQIYDIARQEHERKMLMMADIIRLTIDNLVSRYS